MAAAAFAASSDVSLKVLNVASLLVAVAEIAELDMQIEDGKVAFPVTEVTIAGNLRTMLGGIQAIGDDVDERGAIRTGSILLEKMRIAGN